MGRGHGLCCKHIIASLLAAAIIATIVAVCVVYIPKSHGGGTIDDGPKVTNKDAFKNGGASKHPAKNDDGKNDAKDEYTLYTGKAENFPKKDDWVSFDHMWKSNLETIKTSCSDHGWGENNSDEETSEIKSAIQYVARASLVDHRLILGVVIQESKGCLRVDSTESVHGVHNPGLMQSHSGSSYNPDDRSGSIRQMIKDGTQGTPKGDGLVQLLDRFGNAYSALRGYNSGDVAKSGDLGDAIGATGCYVSDLANRLLGWVKAESKCVEGQSGGVTEGQGEQGEQGQQGQQSQQGQQGQQSQQTSQSGSSSSTTSSSASGANADGTYSGGHWDTNGNYVTDGGSQRRRTRRGFRF